MRLNSFRISRSPPPPLSLFLRWLHCAIICAPLRYSLSPVFSCNRCFRQDHKNVLLLVLRWHLWQAPCLHQYYKWTCVVFFVFFLNAVWNALDSRGKLNLMSVIRSTTSSPHLTSIMRQTHHVGFWIAHASVRTRMHASVSACVLYLNAVISFALCRGLVHGFRGKQNKKKVQVLVDDWSFGWTSGSGDCWHDHLPLFFFSPLSFLKDYTFCCLHLLLFHRLAN